MTERLQTSDDITIRLRGRLVTVPKPDSKPFEPTYPVVLSNFTSGSPKPGDSAGFHTINVNIAACAAAGSRFMMQAMVYDIDPMCREAANVIESLRNDVERLTEMLRNTMKPAHSAPGDERG